MLSFQPIPFTPLDNLLHPHPMSFILFFNVEDINAGIRILTDATSRLLQYIPLLSGVKADLPVSGFKSSKHFIVPPSNELTLQSWVKVQQLSLQMVKFHSDPVLLQQLIDRSWPTEERCLTRITITGLADGVALCLTADHYAFDGRGAFLILEMLADICQGRSPRIVHEHEVILRNMISSLRPVSSALSRDFSKDFINYDNVVKPEFRPALEVRSQRFTLSFPRLMKLTETCNGSWNAVPKSSKTEENISLSLNDVCVSAIALAIMKARNKGSRSKEPSGKIDFGMAVDIRRHLGRVLDGMASYLGNTIVAVSVHTNLPPIPIQFKKTSGLPGIVHDDIYHIFHLGKYLRKELMAIDEDYVCHLLKFLHGNKRNEQVFLAGWGMPFSSLLRLPFYALEFGPNLGSAADFQTVFGGSDGSVYILPRRRPMDGDAEVDTVPIEVCIALDRRDMDQLQVQPLFRWLQGN
ncbi:hypothetical protein BDV33DRAFT_207189 [Aspergillus novoparasiticus]|uniref:Transferase family-domain-containing protein n=1 Tax=Aspergillus novoparasiticus TaxID=986946 RepID=A0A5N6EGX8_9EURO|nr:hypothetical protein BDV33DRAFT_207189 [Aspergillus novoparasiticus]